MNLIEWRSRHRTRTNEGNGFKSSVCQFRHPGRDQSVADRSVFLGFRRVLQACFVRVTPGRARRLIDSHADVSASLGNGPDLRARRAAEVDESIGACAERHFARLAMGARRTRSAVGLAPGTLWSAILELLMPQTSPFRKRLCAVRRR